MKREKLIGIRVSELEHKTLKAYGKVVKKPSTYIFRKQLTRFDGGFDKHSRLRLALDKFLTEADIARHIELGDDLSDVLVEMVLKHA